MAIQHEIEADDLQITRIAQRVQIGAVDIIVSGVRLRANTALPLIDPEQYITFRDLNQHLASGAGVVGFTTSTPSPIVISNWNTLYESQYGTGKFWVQYLNPDGTISDKFDIAITRTLDATKSYQVSVSFDFGLIPLPGQIVIEYSNVPILTT